MRSGRRRRRGRRAALRLLLALTALVALLSFLRSDVFAVRQVTVSGVETVSPDEVRRLAGLDRPLLLWQVWPWRVERRLLRHPRVASAHVAFRWPGQVVVTLVERQPVAYLLLRSGFAEVDGEGRVLGIVPAMRGGGLPIVTGVSADGVQPGQRLGDPAGARALAVAAALGPSGRARVAEIHVTPGGEVVVYTLEGVPVFLGVEEDWEAKVRALQGILATLVEPARTAYVDLRSLRRPVVRMKDAAAARVPPPPAPPPGEVLP